jgi:hypothetical protein
MPAIWIWAGTNVSYSSLVPFRLEGTEYVAFCEHKYLPVR